MSDEPQQSHGRWDSADTAEARKAVQREREKADVAVRELQQRLALARRQLGEERTEREHLASELARIQQRRSPRAVLRALRAARPAMRLLRELRARLQTWHRLRRRVVAALGFDGGRATDPNPFFEQTEGVFGGQLLHLLEPERKDLAHEPDFCGHVADDPLVSIVMVVNQASDPVEPCIRSVLQQTYQHWELIIRDSTGREQVQSTRGVGDARISVARLWSADERVARNHGLAATTGKLIAYLDPPNLWHPRFLETLVGELVQDRASYMVFSQHLDANLADEEWVVRRAGAYPDYAEAVAKGALALNAMMHRRELYYEIGGASKSSGLDAGCDLLAKYGFLRDPRTVDVPLLLQQRSGRDRGPVESEEEQASAALLRASAEAHFRKRLPRRASGRPALTVVSGVEELAHEKAWDFAAVATEVTSTQLVSLGFGGSPAYAPRFVPAAETETLRLEGGRFPQWVSTLARGVANVHGDVVYAAEPRLPSLGLALLASYHHGTRVVAELSRPPLVEGLGGTFRPPSEHPLALDEVDPGDVALLDPHSSVWDRLLAGVARTLPCAAVGSVTAAADTVPQPLVIPHPKDEGVFEAALHDRDAARSRLGLSLTDCVVLCGAPLSAPNAEGVEADIGQRHGLLDELAARFRVLALSAGPVAESVIEGPCQAVDRSDVSAVTTALAASDALLLWVDPQADQVLETPPPELGSALGMQVPVIANDLGELGTLGRQGCLRLVPFGDVDGVATCLEELAHGDRWRAQLAAGSHLFMRQFSYAAARVNVGMMLGVVDRDGYASDAAEDFARFFSAFYRHADQAARSSS